MTVTAIQLKKASELVADHLRGAIVSGEFTLGSTLPVERQLIETYGVSRPTLREALRILETEGLLKVTRGVKGGAKVIGPSLTLASHALGMILQAKGTPLVDVQIARSIIEPPAARMVAERGSPEDLRELRQALEVERATVGTPNFTFAAMRFHETLISLCGNSTIDAFSQILHDIHRGAALMFSKSHTSNERRHEILRQHEQLIHHIEAGDGPAAEQLWRDYWVPFTLERGPAVVEVLGLRD